MTLFRAALQYWDIQSALEHYTGLSLVPNEVDITLEGTIDLNHIYSGFEHIIDKYQIRCSFPIAGFSHQSYPYAYETAARIPKEFHHLNNSALCLGSRARIHITLASNPTARQFIDQLVIPYLYSYSYFELHEVMPFGELMHYNQGLFQDYENMFQVKGEPACLRMLEFLAMKRRLANKQKCPCGSGKWLGRCHHKTLNLLRPHLSKRFCISEILRLKSSDTVLLRHTKKLITILSQKHKHRDNPAEIINHEQDITTKGHCA